MLAVTAVLLLIFISTRFVRLLAEVASGALPGDTVLLLLGLKCVEYLPVILPLALYFAVLLSLGRMYRDSEVTALAACGVGPMHLARSLAVAAPAVFIVVAGLSVYASPWAARYALSVQKQGEQTAEFAGIVAGRFKASRDSDIVMYVDEAAEQGRRLDDIFVQIRQGGVIGLVSAAHGRRWTDPETGDEYMVMIDGYRYEGEPGRADYRIVKFKEHLVRIERKAPGAPKLKRKTLPTEVLAASDDPKYLAELQRRWAAPVTAVLLLFLAVPLSRSAPREGRYARVLLAVLIYFVYNNLLGAAQGYIERGKIPMEIGLWWAPALLAALTAWLLYLQNNPHRRSRIRLPLSLKAKLGKADANT